MAGLKWLQVSCLNKLCKIHLTNKHRNWFGQMLPAHKSHRDTRTAAGLSPHQIPFCRDPLGRGLPLSDDGLAMNAEEFFWRQETTAREMCQQLKKQHAVRAKTAPKSTAHRLRVGDPVWLLGPPPMGTHRTKT